jgi:osmotically-inducible protein OsmY
MRILGNIGAGTWRHCACLFFGVLALGWTCGCAISEREAAKKLDRTQEVIQQASSLYAADKELSRYPIVVDGFRNAMRLKGQVGSEAQKLRAERILWAVPGVQSVDNQLQIRPNPPNRVTSGARDR